MKAHIFIIGILFLIFASVIALNISFQQTLEMEMAEQFNKQQLILARAEAANMDTYISRLKDEMFRISQLISMARIENQSLYEFLATGFLNDLGKVKMAIKFLDSKGKVLFSEGEWAIDSPKNTDFVSKWLEKFCPSEILIKKDVKRVYIVQPICRYNAPDGAIVTSINIHDLAREFLGPIKSGSRGYAWMMDGSGNLLYHPTQPDMIGRNLYNTDTSCFECHQSFDVEKKIIEGRGDYQGKYVSPTGEDKVLAFSTLHVGDTRWIVAITSPYSEVTMALKESTKFHVTLIILIFLTTSVGSALLIFVNRKRVKAEERAKHQKDLERYAEDLEEKVDARTRELTSEKEKLNTVVSAIGSGIMLIDNQRKIQWTNPKMKDIVGQDITGMICDNFFDDCELIGSYKVNDVQTDILSNLFGQSEKYFQVTTAPLKGEDEEAQGFIRLVHDVTEMKRMEEQMMHSEKLALLERLTEGIAKEIGNPLTSVFSFVQMLKEMEKDELKRESLETIHSHMSKIAVILNQLSGFSKMPSMELKPSKINSIIEDSLSLIQYDSRVNEITIVKDLVPGLPDIITDGSQLSQVIVDIVLNATDAMPAGGTLTIQSRVTDKSIVISFEDTGVGIPKEDLSKIFDPFYSTKENGTGLGLTVSQSIIKKLNGRLTVESELHRGSRFVITLPMNEVKQI